MTDPYKDIHVPRVERKKYLEEEGGGKPPPPKKNLILIAILSFFKKFVKIFGKTSKKEEKISSFKTAIKSLKTCMKNLSEKDLSKDSHFLKKFSDSFKSFLDEYDLLYLMKKQKNEKVEKLLKEINNFYAKQEYPLGYYLKEYREENWHPFPFMEILKTLHLDYKKNESKSTLFTWISYLAELS
jgi:hypothetical protein